MTVMSTTPTLTPTPHTNTIHKITLVKLKHDTTKSKKRKKKRQRDGEEAKREEGVSFLTNRFKVMNINLEPYIEDYVLENYFKLHHLMPFQMKSTLHLTFTPHLYLHPPLTCSHPSPAPTPSLAPILSPTLTPHLHPPFHLHSHPPLTCIHPSLIDWVKTHWENKICHRSHDRYVRAKNLVKVPSFDLKYHKKCSYCQPPIIQHPHRSITLTI
jgi:hypothetical protein